MGSFLLRPPNKEPMFSFERLGDHRVYPSALFTCSGQPRVEKVCKALSRLAAVLSFSNVE